jgi:two-component system chemotaxis sensor kinase CheA
MSKYLGLFVAEATDHLAGLSAELVQLEKAGAEGTATAPVVDGIFRHFHSVKGMAASMGFEAISTLAHRAEDLVGSLRRTQSKIEPETADVLLATVDALQVMVTASAHGPPQPADPALLARLEGIGGQAQGTAAAPAATAVPAAKAPSAEAPPPPPPPVQDEASPATTIQVSVRPDTLPAGRREVTIDVEIAGTCPVPAVRAFLVLKKLGSYGTVLRSEPTAADLKAGRIPQKRLTAVLESAAPLQTLERVLRQISDIGGVSLRESQRESAAPPSQPQPTSPSEAPAAEAQRSIRVKTELLDYFLDTVGELILATARLREVGKMIPSPFRPMLDEGVDRLNAIVKDLHDKVMGVRMTPLALVTERLPRAVRDLARRTGKQIELDIQGSEIEIDRAILEELGDPLLHLLRNAVDHGIEAPHLRLLAGKPATGRVTLVARRERDRVLLEIADDGKGMEPEKLRAKAVAVGAVTAEQAAVLSDREALQLACLPGVSTSEVVTDLSGRGVGMDAVKRTLENVGGTLEIDSGRGTGTRFLLSLPLTVAVQPVLLVLVGEEVFGLPIAKVHGAAQVELARLDRSQGTPLLLYGGSHLPVRELGPLLGFRGQAPGPIRSVVVTEGDGGRVGLAVDALLGQQDAVLKPLAPPLDLVPGLSAVTVLGSGRPVFILDVPRLLAA